MVKLKKIHAGLYSYPGTPYEMIKEGPDWLIYRMDGDVDIFYASTSSLRLAREYIEYLVKRKAALSR